MKSVATEASVLISLAAARLPLLLRLLLGRLRAPSSGCVLVLSQLKRKTNVMQPTTRQKTQQTTKQTKNALC